MAKKASHDLTQPAATTVQPGTVQPGTEQPTSKVGQEVADDEIVDDISPKSIKSRCKELRQLQAGLPQGDIFYNACTPGQYTATVTATEGGSYDGKPVKPLAPLSTTFSGDTQVPAAIAAITASLNGLLGVTLTGVDAQRANYWLNREVGITPYHVRMAREGGKKGFGAKVYDDDAAKAAAKTALQAWFAASLAKIEGRKVRTPKAIA